MTGVNNPPETTSSRIQKTIDEFKNSLYQKNGNENETNKYISLFNDTNILKLLDTEFEDEDIKMQTLRCKIQEQIGTTSELGKEKGATPKQVTAAPKINQRDITEIITKHGLQKLYTHWLKGDPTSKFCSLYAQLGTNDYDMVAKIFIVALTTQTFGSLYEVDTMFYGVLLGIINAERTGILPELNRLHASMSEQAMVINGVINQIMHSSNTLRDGAIHIQMHANQLIDKAQSTIRSLDAVVPDLIEKKNQAKRANPIIGHLQQPIAQSLQFQSTSDLSEDRVVRQIRLNGRETVRFSNIILIK